MHTWQHGAASVGHSVQRARIASILAKYALRQPAVAVSPAAQAQSDSQSLLRSTLSLSHHSANRVQTCCDSVRDTSITKSLLASSRSSYRPCDPLTRARFVILVSRTRFASLRSFGCSTLLRRLPPATGVPGRASCSVLLVVVSDLRSRLRLSRNFPSLVARTLAGFTREACVAVPLQLAAAEPEARGGFAPAALAS